MRSNKWQCCACQVESASDFLYERTATASSKGHISRPDTKRCVLWTMYLVGRESKNDRKAQIGDRSLTTSTSFDFYVDHCVHTAQAAAHGTSTSAFPSRQFHLMLIFSFIICCFFLCLFALFVSFNFGTTVNKVDVIILACGSKMRSKTSLPPNALNYNQLSEQMI